MFQSRPKALNFIKKETLTQVFSCEYCKISKSNFFNRIPPVAASKLLPNHCFVDKTYTPTIELGTGK